MTAPARGPSRDRGGAPIVSPSLLAQEGYTASDFISEPANKSGISLGLARKGLGAIPGFF